MFPSTSVVLVAEVIYLQHFSFSFLPWFYVAAGSRPLVAQLMRIHVVTPKAPIKVMFQPVVVPCPNGPEFHPGWKECPSMPVHSYWILRLPFIYCGKLRLQKEYMSIETNFFFRQRGLAFTPKRGACAELCQACQRLHSGGRRRNDFRLRTISFQFLI